MHCNSGIRCRPAPSLYGRGQLIFGKTCLLIDGAKLSQYSCVGPSGDVMSRLREAIVALVSISLLITPVWSAPSSSLGTIVYADRARMGVVAASVGATVFGGDRLSTEQSGSVQVRAGAARLLLSGASSATFQNDEASPAAILTLGSATFSTANSKAFALHVASAVIRPNSDAPTVGQVTVLGPKELVVKSTRGSLTVAVEDDVRVVAEGTAYRIVLDSPATASAPQGPRGAGGRGAGGPPIKAAKSRFIWYATGITTLIAVWAVHEALESEDRP